MKSAYNFYQLWLCLFLLLFCLPEILFAQDQEERKWQWVKRGGSFWSLNTIDDYEESVYEIKTDSNQNIYMLSTVGPSDIDIDGHELGDNYDSEYSRTDFILASLTCEGEYRWSKIIGGGHPEQHPHIVIDVEDNVHIVGRFSRCGTQGGNPEYPSRIDNDTILANTPDSCQALFKAKYSSEGEMLAFNLPQERGADTVVIAQTNSLGFHSDLEGNMYWFLYLPPGTYEDGAFVAPAYENAGKNRFHIFKYNPQGEFVEAITPDIEVSAFLIGWDGLHPAFNPYNKQFYFYINRFKPDTQTAIFGGQQATKSFVLASYDEQGNFLWMREDSAEVTGFSSPYIYNLAFDENSNIYLGGKLGSYSNLLGFEGGVYLDNFVMKADPAFENLIWASHSYEGDIHTGSASEYGALLIANDELVYTGWGGGEEFIWGDQSHYFNPTGTLADVLFARFDIETGACLEINNIVSDPGFMEYGASLAVDAAGDYLVGGLFRFSIYDDFGNVYYNGSGGYSDFFIAKYATQACNEPLSVEPVETTVFKVYPNPVKEQLHVTNLQTQTAYSLYTINGSLVSFGQLQSDQNSISTSKLTSGLYFLKLQDQKGRTQVIKVVKE